MLSLLLFMRSPRGDSGCDGESQMKSGALLSPNQRLRCLFFWCVLLTHGGTGALSTAGGDPDPKPSSRTPMTSAALPAGRQHPSPTSLAPQLPEAPLASISSPPQAPRDGGRGRGEVSCCPPPSPPPGRRRCPHSPEVSCIQAQIL